MRQDPEVRKCKSCGEMPPLHAYTCKELPPRQDVVDFLRAQLIESAQKLEFAGREIEQLKKDKEVLIEQRDAACERQDYTHLQVRELTQVVLLVDQALSGVRLVGGDQNPLGWRDFLGSAASKVRKSQKPKDDAAVNPWAPNKDYPGKPIEKAPGMPTTCIWCKRKPVVPPWTICSDCLDASAEKPAEPIAPSEAANQLTQEAQDMGMYDAPKCQVDVPIQGGDTKRCWMPLPCQFHPQNSTGG